MTENKKLAELPKDRPSHEVAKVAELYGSMYPNHIVVRGLADGKIGIYKSYWNV